ncbi:MAG: S8 family serine peptidase [Mariprofundaceae bacterium]
MSKPLQYTLFTLMCVVFCLEPAYAVQLSGFDNFSKKIVLSAKDGDWFRLLDSQQVQVKVSKRIIMKVKPSITKVQLFTANRSIKKITKIYQMASGTYFLLEIAEHSNFQRVFDQLSKLPFTQFIQPDLLQKRNDAVTPNKRLRNHALYLEKLGIRKRWKESRGKGVKIAIIDDGFKLDHEDFQGVNVVFSYDVEQGVLDATPKFDVDTHGTQVAGIIFAQHNQVGIDGIAPEAELIALRHSDTWTSRILLAFYLAKIAKADVINCSWSSSFLLEPVADAIHDLTTTGRGGKGIAVVFSAGNQGRKLEINSGESALHSVISVGSVDKNRNRLRFSNYGEPVDVYVQGRGVQTTVAEGGYGNFSGTSASAPIISGLIALMLAERPLLPLREIERELKMKWGEKNVVY